MNRRATITWILHAFLSCLMPFAVILAFGGTIKANRVEFNFLLYQIWFFPLSCVLALPANSISSHRALLFGWVWPLLPAAFMLLLSVITRTSRGCGGALALVFAGMAIGVMTVMSILYFQVLWFTFNSLGLGGSDKAQENNASSELSALWEDEQT